MRRIVLFSLIGSVVLALALLAGGTDGPAQAQGPAHYKCYEIDGLPPEVPPVDLETQFGLELGVDVGEPALLCAPALKNDEGDLNLPHLECYNIIGEDPPHIVNLETQFGLELDVEVAQAQLLCVPADKEVLFPVPEPPSGLVPEVPHHKCYQIDGLPPAVLPVDLETQFGLEPGVVVGEPALLCPPALKNDEGDLNLPHLECYNIIGEDPPHIVNLQTQFGFELDVEVGPAQLLCVEAVKTVLIPVGGIAELPDVAQPSLETAASPSGSSAPPYAAIAGAAAAAAVAIAAGGWYARRRLLR